jgi:hypothetical protein
MMSAADRQHGHSSGPKEIRQSVSWTLTRPFLPLVKVADAWFQSMARFTMPSDEPLVDQGRANGKLNFRTSDPLAVLVQHLMNDNYWYIGKATTIMTTPGNRTERQDKRIASPSGINNAHRDEHHHYQIVY